MLRIIVGKLRSAKLCAPEGLILVVTSKKFKQAKTDAIQNKQKVSNGTLKQIVTETEIAYCLASDPRTKKPCNCTEQRSILRMHLSP